MPPPLRPSPDHRDYRAHEGLSPYSFSQHDRLPSLHEAIPAIREGTPTSGGLTMQSCYHGPRGPEDNVQFSASKSLHPNRPRASPPAELAHIQPLKAMQGTQYSSELNGTIQLPSTADRISRSPSITSFSERRESQVSASTAITFPGSKRSSPTLTYLPGMRSPDMPGPTNGNSPDRRSLPPLPQCLPGVQSPCFTQGLPPMNMHSRDSIETAPYGQVLPLINNNNIRNSIETVPYGQQLPPMNANLGDTIDNYDLEEDFHEQRPDGSFGGVYDPRMGQSSFSGTNVAAYPYPPNGIPVAYVDYEKTEEEDQQKPKKRRGNLPKPVTDRLRRWFNEHIAHPYPTEHEKQMLMHETGLAIGQISNWFINARRRSLPVIQKQAKAETTLRIQHAGDSAPVGNTNGGRTSMVTANEESASSKGATMTVPLGMT